MANCPFCHKPVSDNADAILLSDSDPNCTLAHAHCAKGTEEISTYDIMALARASNPSVKWAYRNINDVVSELMPLCEDGKNHYAGRLYAAYDPSTETIIRVDVYCRDPKNFATEAEAQAYIDKLVF